MIHEKTNEIPGFQEMLTYLDVEGKTVTADAMHCQREICRRIIRGKGNYLLGLKENQPSLSEDIRVFFEDANEKELDSFQTLEKNAGRIEKRICRKIKDISWLKEHKWPGLQSVFSIERITQTRGKSSKLFASFDSPTSQVSSSSFLCRQWCNLAVLPRDAP